jgi:hypothetical protein
MTYLIAFGLFSLAVAAMGVGVMLSGRRLSTSCGGLSKQGEAIGDCSCARKKAELCTDGPDQELVDLAEVGWPLKRERHTHDPRHERRGPAPRAKSLEV